MNQNQSAGTPENDLQKAIDNITNQNRVDPIFSEPVAAPSSIPDGDNGELSDPVGPFPMPGTTPDIGVVTESESKIAPIEPLSLPKLDVSGKDPADATVITRSGSADPDEELIPPSAPKVSDPFNPPAQNQASGGSRPSLSPEPNHISIPTAAPTPEPSFAPTSDSGSRGDLNLNSGSDLSLNPDPNQNPNPASSPASPTDASANFAPDPGSNPSPDPNSGAASDSPSDAAPGNSIAPDSSTVSDNSDSAPDATVPGDDHDLESAPNAPGNVDIAEIKKEILKKLSPVLENTKADSSQKFKIYYETMQDLHDYSVLDKAYQAASNIQSDEERAESLLSLLESIDSM